METPTTSLYSRLGVPHDASPAAISKAYRKLALQFHPDKGGSADEFRRYAEAYGILSDPEKRRCYDATGEASLSELDVDGMMAEVFAEGGWFEQMVERDSELKGIMEEEGLKGMQKSFGSFFAAAMGGSGPVYMPDGSVVEAPCIKLPSLHELMESSDDPEERELMMRVQRKMGIGSRGAMVAGTGMQALQILQKMGSDPSFWHSDDEDEAEDDAYLDDLQAQLRARGVSSQNPEARHKTRQGEHSGASVPNVASTHSAGPSMDRFHDVCTASNLSMRAPSTPPVSTETARCTAPPSVGKAWLDMARQGQLRELRDMHKDDPSLVNFQGSGLGQTALHWSCTKSDELTTRWLLSVISPLAHDATCVLRGSFSLLDVKVT